MDATAVLLKEPESLALARLPLIDPAPDDVVVDVAWSGISTGTERLLYQGRMPDFPGMGYPLVPGYESVGVISDAGPAARAHIGETVFIPGAKCFTDVRSLFGASASRLVVPAGRVIPIDPDLGERGVLLALAATAYHAAPHHDAEGRALHQPDLIVGHGVLGRLQARLAMAAGHAPVVWEVNPARMDGAEGYEVLHPDDDPRRDYRVITDVSGDKDILDTLIGRLAPCGEIVLAGFYAAPLSFNFPPAFMREARIRVAAQFLPGDIAAVQALLRARKLSLDGLITHREPARAADAAYRTAFGSPECLKMILDWSNCA